MKALLRGGRFIKDGGVAQTRSGELAVVCPACPHPKINIPAAFREVSPERACVFIYLRLLNYLYSDGQVYVLSIYHDGCQFLSHEPSA
jgi:hypothetical protein